MEELFAGRIGEHEAGVMRLMAGFASERCAFAPGWRCQDVMGDRGTVAPDAVVWIESGPFGAGWHYVEYERRARSPARVRAKLRGYQSDLRVNSYPLLVVCRPGVEKAFWEAGRELEMLTTTVQEARSGPVVGREGTVWRHFGRPVSVLSGQPAAEAERVPA